MRHQYDNKKMILNEARRQECRYVKKPLHHGTILSLAVLLLLVSPRRLLRCDIQHDSKSLHQGQGASSKLERRQYGSRIASCQTTAPVKPSQRRRRERERSQRNNSNSTVWEYSSSPSCLLAMHKLCLSNGLGWSSFDCTGRLLHLSLRLVLGVGHDVWFHSECD